MSCVLLRIIHSPWYRGNPRIAFLLAAGFGASKRCSDLSFDRVDEPQNWGAINLVV